MENNRHVNKIAALIITAAIFLLGPFFVFAYSTATHSALTDETIVFFNSYFDNSPLGGGEKILLKQGSVNEDDGVRALHHFYDPIYNRGLVLFGDDFGGGGNLAGVAANFKLEYSSSKSWAGSSIMQASIDSLTAGTVRDYFSSDIDFSWERAIYEYAWGDKDRGLEALGHVLHLIQDASVPDHTRNDPHPPYFDELFNQASPYEGWTKKFDDQNIDLVSKLDKERPVILNSLDEYFDNLATYSNNNFFSKDTTPDKDATYSSPQDGLVMEEKLSSGDIATFVLSQGTDKHKLAKIKADIITDTKIYFLEDLDNLILTDYWSRLSKQAVLHGAGVIKLFFDEVEKEKETKVLYNKNRSWFQKAFDATKNTIFNVASVFYGSSVTLEDLDSREDDLATPPPSGQAAAVVEIRSPEGEEGTESAEGEVVRGDEAILELVPEAVLPSEPDSGIRDRFGLVALPSGGGAIGGGGSPSASAQDTTPPAPPVVTTPADFSSAFKESTVTFSGTAEAGSVISQNITGDATTTSTTGVWSLELSLGQGSTTIQFFASDSSGNISAPLEITIFVDSIAPDLNFDIAECGNSLTAGCLSTSTTATLVWSSSAVDIAGYELGCSLAETVCAGFPKTFSATSSVQISEALNDYASYIFTLKIFDNTGNEAQVSKNIETASRPVVINEIAWMGTASSSVSLPADEWIELYNNTSQEINMNGWILRAEDNTPYVILAGPSIPAKGYYLLERTDDNTISDISTDQIYGNDGASWALNNSGERLFLERVFESATTTVDEVIKCNNWCGKGDNTSKQTMERIDPRVSGAETSNWGTAFGKWPEELVLLNGKSADGSAIKGTPKAKNSVTHLIARGNLSGDKTLTKENSPYVVPREGLNILAGVTLTINPGSVIKVIGSNDPRIIVGGTIKSNGEDDDPIVFTSFADDEYGDDTNKDGICNPQDASSTAACPVPGSWMQILVNSTSQNSSFINTIIRYGGAWSSNTDMRSMVAVDGASVTFDKVTIEYSKKHGLYLKNSSGAVSDSIFRYDRVKFPYYMEQPSSDSDAAGLLVGGGAPEINNNTFQGFRYGFSGSTAGASISGNIFNNNAVSAIQADNAVGYFSNNSGSGNGLNGIVIGNSYNISSVGATTTLGANPLPYIIKGEANVTGGSVLVFEPNVVVKGHNSNAGNTGRLVIKKDGKIYFDGSSPSDLIFTSTEDNSVGGNVFGTSTLPADGSWYGIEVKKGGVFAMRGFTLRYAGGLITQQSSIDKAGLRIEEGSGFMANAVFENNFRYGLGLQKVDFFSISSSVFRNHTQKETNVSAATAISVFKSNLTLDNMTYENNGLDIRGSGSYSVSCSENCGSPSTDPDPI